MARKQGDFLDELIVLSEEASPGFKTKVDDALHRRVMGRALAERRAKMGLSQGDIAVRMRTSQPAVSRLEAGGDVRISTLTRYLEVVGIPADWPEQIAHTGKPLRRVNRGPAARSIE